MTGNIRDRQFPLAYFCSHLVDFLFSSLHWPGTSDPELHLGRSRPPFRIRSTPYFSFYPFFPDTYCALSANSKVDINRSHRKKERKKRRDHGMVSGREEKQHRLGGISATALVACGLVAQHDRSSSSSIGWSSSLSRLLSPAYRGVARAVIEVCGALCAGEYISKLVQQ